MCEDIFFVTTAKACATGRYNMDCPLYGIGERLVVGHMQLARIWNVLKVKAMRSLADRKHA